MKQILPVTDMHPVWMPCYTDEYPLLCCTIIKFQHLVFRTCNILKFNVPSCAIQTKQPYFYTHIDATRFDSYTEHVLMTALLDMIARYDACSLLVITCKWNFCMKHDFINNFLCYKIPFRGTCYCSPNSCSQCSTLLWHHCSSKCSNRSANKRTNSRAIVSAIWSRTAVSKCHLYWYWYIRQLQLGKDPVAVVQYTFTHKQ